MTSALTKSQSKELTKPAEFKPTPAMRVWLDSAVKLMTDNISEIERDSKITAQSWYIWLKKPEFITWYRQEWEQRIKHLVPVLDAVGLKYAKRGDVRFWEGMMKRTGGITTVPTPDNLKRRVVAEEFFTEGDQ